MITTHQDFPARILSNGQVKATILTVGASLVSLELADDPDRLNPLWDPQQIAAGRPHPFGRTPGYGHFVCVDGFGQVSPEERRAGLPMHGEAHRQAYDIRENSATTLTLAAELPLVQEALTRKYRLGKDENVLYVESALENLMAFDRPINWAEHATIGAPFLERSMTVVDMSASRAKTRQWTTQQEPPHRLASSKEFTWPLAPVLNGNLIDLRAAGRVPSGDHNTCLMDPTQPHSWITFLHPVRRLLLGYVFEREDFPWVQNWEYYPVDDQLARGMEFSTMPFDIPRRDAIQANALFGTSTYRWLPARSTITTRFLVFWTRTPISFTRIADVSHAKGVITVRDSSGATLELPASG